LWSYTTVLSPEAHSAALAREFVRGHLERHGLPDLVDPVQLAASELATNAMVHARTTFTVGLSRTDGTVLLVVADRCPRRPVLVAPVPTDAGGRGLTIVAGISRTWGVSADPEGAKSVWASFDTLESAG
jgi:anti-sigma regulatory factor (Ser/Thr protein kinase)